MNKFFNLFMIFLLAISLVSCGEKIGFPSVESSGYDISQVMDPLNSNLSQSKVRYSFDDIRDEFLLYL